MRIDIDTHIILSIHAYRYRYPHYNDVLDCRLSRVQETQKSEPAVIFISPSTSHQVLRANVLEDIKSLLPNHQERLSSINHAMTVNDR